MLQAISHQATIIHALFLREIKVMFGKKRLGYLWAFLEPVMHVMLFFMIRNILGKIQADNINPFPFLVTGIVPFFLLRQTANSIMTSMRSNKSLLVFPQIKVGDIISSRALIEFVTNFMVFWVLIFACYLSGINISPENLLAVFYLYITFWFFGISFGVLAMVINSVLPVTKYAIKFVIQIFYFTSGIIISVERIPANLREYLEWNPVLHLVELFRGAFFDVYTPVSPFTSLDYVYWVIAGLFIAGLVLKKRLFRYIVGDEI